MATKLVYILRGLPGSFKSTYVRYLKHHVPDLLVCSADDYHVDPATGKYDFKPENLVAAHRACLLKFVGWLQADKAHGFKDDTVVVVDNTNLSAAEVAPYYRLAEAYGFEPEVINFPPAGGVEACLARTVHGVPPLSMGYMAHAFESAVLPPRWHQITMPIVPTPDHPGGVDPEAFDRTNYLPTALGLLAAYREQAALAAPA